MSVISHEKELLVSLEALSSTHNIPKAVLIEGIQSALKAALLQVLGQEADITVRIDANTGRHFIERSWQVVELVDNPAKQILHSTMPNAELESIHTEQLSADVFNRISINLYKKYLATIIRREHNKRVCQELEQANPSIVKSKVIALQPMALEVSMLKHDMPATLPKKYLLPSDQIRSNALCEAYVYSVEVKGEYDSLKVILSRTHVDMIRGLLKREVPEINAGFIEIISIKRAPGIRAKVAIKAKADSHIAQPVGICIGFKGTRIQNISNVLNGEKIDIFLWDDDPHQCLLNAFSGLKPLHVDLNPITKTIYVYVQSTEVAKFIGARGINIFLISCILGWKITALGVIEPTDDAAWDKITEDQELAHIKTHKNFVKTIITEPHTIKSLFKLDQKQLFDLRNRTITYLKQIQTHEHKQTYDTRFDSGYDHETVQSTD